MWVSAGDGTVIQISEGGACAQLHGGGLFGRAVCHRHCYTNTNKVMAHEYPHIYIYIRDGSVHVSVPFGSRTNSKWK